MGGANAIITQSWVIGSIVEDLNCRREEEKSARWRRRHEEVSREWIYTRVWGRVVVAHEKSQRWRQVL